MKRLLKKLLVLAIVAGLSIWSGLPFSVKSYFYQYGGKCQAFDGCPPPEKSQIWLKDAVDAKKTTLVKLLLLLGANPSSVHGTPSGILRTAVEKNNIDIAKALLNNGAIHQNSCGMLIHASRNQNVAMVKLLFDKGLNATHCSGAFKTVLKNQNIEILELILRKGEFDQSKRIGEKFPYQMAQDTNNDGIIKLFKPLESVATKEVIKREDDKKAKQQLSWALNRLKRAMKTSNIKAIDDELNIVGIGRVLEMAAQNANMKVVKHLLPQDFSEDEIDAALGQAGWSGDIELVKLLLTRKHSQNGLNAALMGASYRYSAEMIQFLIDKGADVNTRREGWGTTSLHQALNIGHNKKEIAEVLLRNGANINAKDNDGRTPMHHQVYSPDLAKFLVEHGASVTEKDTIGRTPLHRLANSSVHKTEFAKERIDLLLAEGADINAQDANGNTPLMVASKDLSTGNIEALLMSGANPKIKNKLGLTALDIANERIEAINERIKERTTISNILEAVKQVGVSHILEQRNKKKGRYEKVIDLLEGAV